MEKSEVEGLAEARVEFDLLLLCSLTIKSLISDVIFFGRPPTDVGP